MTTRSPPDLTIYRLRQRSRISLFRPPRPTPLLGLHFEILTTRIRAVPHSSLPLPHPPVHLFERHATGAEVPIGIMLVIPSRRPRRHDIFRTEGTPALRITDFLRVVIMTGVKADIFRACLAEPL